MKSKKMKKMNVIYKTWINLMLLVLLSGMANSVMAQTFTRPRYKAKNARNVGVELIEITEEHTIIYLSVFSPAPSSIKISSETYIVNSEGGDPLYIEKAEALYRNNIDRAILADKTDELRLNELYNNPTFTFLKLYFPKIGQDVNTINYRSGNNGNFWHFFEISIATDIGVDRSIKSGRKGVEGTCRFIESPGYIAKSGGFNITEIELCDTATILHFIVNISNGGSFSVPSKSCIRDSNGGENLFVISAEGTNMDQKNTFNNTNKGSFYYKLFFPPLNKSVKKIDFRELNQTGNWYVYELDVDVDE